MTYSSTRPLLWHPFAHPAGMWWEPVGLGRRASIVSRRRHVGKLSPSGCERHKVHPTKSELIDEALAVIGCGLQTLALVSYSMYPNVLIVMFERGCARYLDTDFDCTLWETLMSM